jgi:uncharacterized membrane protein YfcA
MPLSDLTPSGSGAWYSGLVLLGLVTGVLTGLLGIGGGFLTTPALNILFGIAYPVAVGTSLAQIMAATLLSTLGHWRRKNVDLKLGLLMAAGSLAGAEIGVRLLQAITALEPVTISGRPQPLVDLVLNSCYLVLMAGVAAFMLRESLACRSGEPQTALADQLRTLTIRPVISLPASGIEQISIWVPGGISLAVGCLAGLLGIGGGFVGLPLMLYLMGLPTRQAVGTSTLQVFVASAYGGLRHWQQGHADLFVALWLILGAVIGIRIGLKLCARVDARAIRQGFAVLLLLAALLVASRL